MNVCQWQSNTILMYAGLTFSESKTVPQPLCYDEIALVSSDFWNCSSCSAMLILHVSVTGLNPGAMRPGKPLPRPLPKRPIVPVSRYSITCGGWCAAAVADVPSTSAMLSCRKQVLPLLAMAYLFRKISTGRSEAYRSSGLTYTQKQYSYAQCASHNSLKLVGPSKASDLCSASTPLAM